MSSSYKEISREVANIHKVDLLGKVVCTICKALISYQSGGKKDVKNHVKKKEHKRLLEIKTSNIKIPSSFLPSASIPVQECNMAYGTPPNVHDARICGGKAKQPL